jgi:hypothetical protein
MAILVERLVEVVSKGQLNAICPRIGFPKPVSAGVLKVKAVLVVGVTGLVLSIWNI